MEGCNVRHARLRIRRRHPSHALATAARCRLNTFRRRSRLSTRKILHRSKGWRVLQNNLRWQQNGRIPKADLIAWPGRTLALCVPQAGSLFRLSDMAVQQLARRVRHASRHQRTQSVDDELRQTFQRKLRLLRSLPRVVYLMSAGTQVFLELNESSVSKIGTAKIQFFQAFIFCFRNYPPEKQRHCTDRMESSIRSSVLIDQMFSEAKGEDRGDRLAMQAC